MALNPDDPLAGGPSGYYQPEFGMLAIQQPDAFAAHMARMGAPPPTDFPEGFKLEDAHNSLGKSLNPTQMADASSNPFASMSPNSRVNDTFHGALGYGEEFGGRSGLPGDELPGGIGPSVGQRLRDAAAAREGRPPVPAAPASAAEPPFVPQGPMPPPPATPPVVAQPAPPSRSEEEPEPPDTSPLKDTAKGEVKPGGKARGSSNDPGDSLGKALAGLAAMKPPPPPMIHSPAAPHATNQLSRSNVPQLLMQEIAAAGNPQARLRLGQALLGR